MPFFRRQKRHKGGQLTEFGQFVVSGGIERNMAKAAKEGAIAERFSGEQQAILRDMLDQGGKIHGANTRGISVDASACKELLARYNGALEDPLFRSWHDLRLKHDKAWVLDELREAADGKFA